MEPITTIIPFCEKYTPRDKLDEAIDSIEAQSIPTEVIVINDEDERGPAWARNQGLEQAETRFVAFLDADDFWMENKLKSQLDILKNTNTAICIEGQDADKEGLIETDRFIRGLLFGDRQSLTSTIVVDTNQVEVNFNENLSRFEDHLFMIEAAVEGGISVVNPPVVEIRKHDQGLTSTETPDENFESMKQMANILDEHPRTERYTTELRQLAHILYGHQQQLSGKHIQGCKEQITALKYGFNIKALGSLGFTPIYVLYSLYQKLI